FESYLSREAAFLFNNLVLVGIAFAVFWGTLFPVLSEAVRGVKITVGPPFFGVTTGVCAFVAGLREWYVLTAMSLAAFVLGTIFVEFRRGVSARRHMVAESVPVAIVNLIGKNNRRYGGYVIHIGVVLAFTGIVASAFFKTEVKQSVKSGDSFQV